jgi:large subunit ribosomal protein L29
MMKIDELRGMNKDELMGKLAGFKEELSKIRYLQRIGQVEKPHRFRQLRKSIARVMTLLKEKESKM